MEANNIDRASQCLDRFERFIPLLRDARKNPLVDRILTVEAFCAEVKEIEVCLKESLVTETPETQALWTRRGSLYDQAIALITPAEFHDA